MARKSLKPKLQSSKLSFIPIFKNARYMAGYPENGQIHSQIGAGYSLTWSDTAKKLSDTVG